MGPLVTYEHKWKRNIGMTEPHRQQGFLCPSPVQWRVCCSPSSCKKWGWYVPARGTAHCVCHSFWIMWGTDIAQQQTKTSWKMLIFLYCCISKFQEGKKINRHLKSTLVVCFSGRQSGMHFTQQFVHHLFLSEVFWLQQPLFQGPCYCVRGGRMQSKGQGEPPRARASRTVL